MSRKDRNLGLLHDTKPPFEPYRTAPSFTGAAHATPADEATIINENQNWKSPDVCFRKYFVKNRMENLAEGAADNSDHRLLRRLAPDRRDDPAGRCSTIRQFFETGDQRRLAALTRGWREDRRRPLYCSQ